MIYHALRKQLFRIPPETAHILALTALEVATALPSVDPRLRRLCASYRPCRAFGVRFKNPVGLAAGFDKNARHVQALAALGFGFIEIGSVTARPVIGNPKPRMFRLPASRAIINRMGLNNDGADAVAARLERLKPRPVPVFANIAKTPDPDVTGALAVDDYVITFDRLAAYVDAVVLNVSCPNSKDGRTFQDPGALSDLLGAIRERQAAYPHLALIVKLAPDLDSDELAAAVAVCERAGANGITMGNTTTARPHLLYEDAKGCGGPRTPEEYLSGGLSGEPLRPLALEKVRELRGLTKLPIIGVGGVSTADHAADMLDAGASLVQLYTGFVYGGPLTVKRIVDGLREQP